MSAEDRQLLDLTHDLILTLGFDVRICAANRTAHEALGYDAAQLMGRAFDQLVSLDSREGFESCLETVRQGVPVRGFHFTIMTCDGRPLRVEANFHPHQVAECQVISVFLRSLTEQQQVRQALRESEKQLRTVLAAVPDVLLVLDHAGHYRQVFTADADLLVAPAEELLGKSLEETLSPAEAAAERRTIDQVIRTQQPTHSEYELNVRGQRKWFSARVVPFGTERDPCVLWVSRDITSLVRAREKQQEDQQLLRSLLELETKAREVVAYEIHDGFVQYAVGTQMWLQTAADYLDNAPDELATAVQTALDSNAQAVEEARAMIRDLRPVVVEETGIDSGLRQLVEVMQKQSTVPLYFDCRQPPPKMLQLLEGQVFRIVQESLHNVIRHSRASEATVSVDVDQQELRVEVTDNGVGFDPCQIPADRYGLEGIQRRASAFGGTAVVDSRPGGGTRIRVMLPILQPEESSPSEAQSDDVSRLNEVS